MSLSRKDWFLIENVDEVESPALLIYPERASENIRRMVALAGQPARLRPHAKTHKLAQIASRQIAAGIKKFKAATISEAEMLARAGAADVLLAYQPVGPNARRFLELITAFPQTIFACLLDDFQAAQKLSELTQGRAVAAHPTTVNVLLDIDCGQHRTGVPPDERAIQLYQEIGVLPGLRPIGLHAYDGHIRAGDPEQRKRECDAACAPVLALREKLRQLGFPINTLVLSGTPTFPIHAERQDAECSPGTCVLWDFSSSSQFGDLDFLHAALVLARVVSKPGNGRLCVDLGHKAIASENPHPRVHFLNAPSARAVGHSEEHLVLETESAADWNVGDCLYGIPWHVCPTVALYAEAVVVESGRASEKWRIEARDRHLRF